MAAQEPELNLAQLSNRRGAAFHEAGHTVVAWSIEIAFDDDDAKGGAQIGATDRLPTIDRIAICLAGMEAQHMFAAPTHELAGVADFATWSWALLKMLTTKKVSRSDDEAISNLTSAQVHKLLGISSNWAVVLKDAGSRDG